MSAPLSVERKPECAPQSPEFGWDWVCFARLDSFQSCYQLFDRTEVIAAPAEGADHLLKEWCVVVGRAPRAATGSLLGGQRGGERIAELGEKQPQIPEEGI